MSIRSHWPDFAAMEFVLLLINERERRGWGSAVRFVYTSAGQRIERASTMRCRETGVFGLAQIETDDPANLRLGTQVIIGSRPLETILFAIPINETWHLKHDMVREHYARPAVAWVADEIDKRIAEALLTRD